MANRILHINLYQVFIMFTYLWIALKKARAINSGFLFNKILSAMKLTKNRLINPRP